MMKPKSIAYLMCLVGALLAMGSMAPYAHAQQNGLGIAAVVNDDVISMLDLDNRISIIVSTSSLENTPETRARIAPQVLRSLIDEKLMLQESRRVGITVAQADINNRLELIAQDNNLTVDQLGQQLDQIGVPLTALTARIESEIGWQVFVGRRLAQTIKIGEEEINDEIKRIEASAGKPEYLLAEIFLPVDSPSQDSEVQQLAARLIQQMQSGAPFNALASNFSRAPSAAKGGDMGWVQSSHLDPEILRAISQLPPGQVTMPVRTLGGYFIVLLRDVRTSPGLGSGEATMKVSQLHLQLTPQTDTNTLTQHLQRLVQGVNTCPAFEAIGENSGSALSGPLGEVTLSTLPPEMRAVLEPLGVGQPSRPIATGGGLAMLMICERQDQGVDMEKIRTQIADALTGERLDIVARRHLRDLRRTAFVDIRL